jgi:hypothetical protein
VGLNTSRAEFLQGLRGRGRGSGALIKQSENAADALVQQDFYFDAAGSGSVNATIASGQSQGVSATAQASLVATIATEQAQSATATASGTPAVNATVNSGQAQGASIAAQKGINALAASGQAQGVSVTAARAIASTVSSGQSQGASATTARALQATASSGQSQGVAAIGQRSIAVTVSAGQAQSAQASGLSLPISAAANEVIINPKKYYIRRKEKILLFNSAQEADEFIEAEQQAEQAAQTKTSRSARKRARKNIGTFTQVSFDTVDLSGIELLAKRYDIGVDMPSLLIQQDWDRVVEIYHLAMQLQDEEDVEILLMV